MKKILLVPLLLLLMSMNQQKKARIIFFGDSVTQMGADKGGFIDRIQQNINQKGIQDNYELIGAGAENDKIYDLYLRMDDDVMAKEPTVVVINTGINDIAQKYTSHTGTDIGSYEKFYEAIIKKLQAKNIKVILATPAVVGEKADMDNPLDAELNKYCNIVKGIARKSGLPLVDLRTLFMDYYKKNNPRNEEKNILTTDRVHLNAKGNRLVAGAMWNAVKSL